MLKALAQIEEGMDVRDSRVAASNSTKQPAQQSKHSAHQPTSIDVKQSRSKPVTEPIEVHFEILSNWTHEQRVGLTEIQLFDANRRRIDVQEANVMVHNLQNPRGDVMCLFNGKYKVHSAAGYKLLANSFCLRFRIYVIWIMHNAVL